MTHLDSEAATTILGLMRELSSELDLHYEHEDLPALAPTIEVLSGAARLLEQRGTALPPAYLHILGRFQRVSQ